MKKNFIIALLLLFNLAACTSLTEDGSRVSISHTVWQGCRFVAAIKGSETDSNSDLALRNKAGKMGANLVVVTGYANHGLLYGEIPSSGDAYKCVSEVEKKTAEEKIRLENEKKMAEERARLEAERKLAEEKAKADEIARIEADKAKIEAEKKLIAEEMARLEQLKAEAEAKLKEVKSERVADQKESTNENSVRMPAENKAQPEKEGSTSSASDEKSSQAETAEKKTKISDHITPEGASLDSQISKEKTSSSAIQ